MNKKGQIQIYFIVAVVSIFLCIISYSIGYNKGDSKTESILQELESQRIYSQQLERQLEGKDIELDNTLNELNNCVKGLENKSNELNECQSLRETLPIFWIANVYLTNSWVVLLNISLGLSIVSIYNIFKWLKKNLK